MRALLARWVALARPSLNTLASTTLFARDPLSGKLFIINNLPIRTEYLPKYLPKGGTGLASTPFGKLPNYAM
jgi:hypothetical protein